MSDTPRGSDNRTSSPFSRQASADEPSRTLYRPAGAEQGASTGRFSAPTASGRPVRTAAAATAGTTGAPSSQATPAQAPTTHRSGQPADAGVGITQQKPSPSARPAASASSASSSRVAGAAAAAPARRTRKARLRLSRVDPWSVMKTSFLFSIAFGILLVVAVWVLWAVLQSSGTFESINRAVNDLLATPNSASTFDLGRYVTGDRVIGFTALIAAADVVIFTALATLFSFLYNLSATVLGGLEVTLAED